MKQSKTSFILLVMLLTMWSMAPARAQVSISDSTGSVPDASAMLDVSVTASTKKGLLIPRMTQAGRTSIISPATGLLVFQTDGSAGFHYYSGSLWTQLTAGGTGGSGTTNYLPKFTASTTLGNSLVFDDGTNVGINNAAPSAKLHIKGNADNTQLIIDANAIQSNTNPLIKLRNSAGTDLMWIHSDNALNTFIGLNAGRVNNAGGGGTNNTFIGRDAGFSNTTGTANTANGSQALYYNTTGTYNTANGYQALYNNTTGRYNSANGYQALYYNTTGTHNTANGYQALFSNTHGTYNSANGYQALCYNTTGYQNTANGVAALYSNTTGFQNTANGYAALISNTTGDSNTANGVAALSNNTTGNYNTAFGFNAGLSISTGSNNTTVGYNAQVPVATNSNQVRIGNTFVTYAGVQVAWTITSDKRWKSNIQNSNLGLDFISKLRSVSYFRTNDPAQKTEYGFIAQELEEALNASGAGNNGMISKDDKGMYSLRYNDLLSPMVKAVQELNKQNKELTDRVAALEAMVKSLLNEKQKATNTSLGELR